MWDVFTPACHSVHEGSLLSMHYRSHDQHGGGGVCIQGVFVQGVCIGGEGLPTGGWADPPAGTRKVGGTHPIGMLSCLATFLAKSALLSLDSPGDPTLTDKMFLDFMFYGEIT